MGKHYAISDLHGMYNIYEQVCKMLAPDDVVYFLGDAGDRGYDGWKLIKAIYNNPQWIYIKGNHEEMAANAIIEYCSEERLDDDYYLWMSNGGEKTMAGWSIDGQRVAWAFRLKKLPTLIEYLNEQGQVIELCHAGFTPKIGSYPTDEDLIWDRYHFYDEWNVDFNDTIVIHGHTPLSIFYHRIWYKDCHYDEKDPHFVSYCGGHKINIDNGCFYTKAAILLDLDTFEETIIWDKTDWEYE